MRLPLRPGQLTGLRCPAPECRYADVWVLSLRDWEVRGYVLVHCRTGHVLRWYPEAATAARNAPAGPPGELTRDPAVF